MGGNFAISQTGLTPKQARFVEEYTVDFNATQAAIRAGYSKKTAYSQGQRLLKNVEIARALAKRRKAISKTLEITTRMVAEGLLAEARGERSDTTAASRVSAWAALGRVVGAVEKDNAQRGNRVMNLLDEIPDDILVALEARLEAAIANQSRILEENGFIQRVSAC